MDNLIIKTVDSASEMMAQYELITQLNPKVTLQDYMLMINDMVTLNYKQAVAYSNEKPVGICGFWINTKIYSGKYIELDNVVVDTNFRSKNIGQLLCDYVLEIAKQNNCKTAMLDAYLENTQAHVFYQRIGFTKKGFHFIKPL
jgi:ribosomal protein S18 acetylase RimI-like enzyme